MKDRSIQSFHIVENFFYREKSHFRAGNRIRDMTRPDQRSSLRADVQTTYQSRIQAPRSRRFAETVKGGNKNFKLSFVRVAIALFKKVLKLLLFDFILFC